MEKIACGQTISFHYKEFPHTESVLLYAALVLSHTRVCLVGGVLLPSPASISHTQMSRCTLCFLYTKIHKRTPRETSRAAAGINTSFF